MRNLSPISPDEVREFETFVDSLVWSELQICPIERQINAGISLLNAEHQILSE